MSLVARGLGRDRAAPSLFVSGGLGRYEVVISGNDMRVTMSGTSSLAVSPTALANIQAALSGAGTFTAAPTAAGHLQADLAGAGALIGTLTTAGLSSDSTWVNLGGNWYQINAFYVYHVDAWHLATELYVRASGAWTKIW